MLLIPVGIWLRRRKPKAQGQVLDVYPAINLREPMVRRAAFVVGAATFLNVLIFATASYRGEEYMDSTQFCGQTCHTVMTAEFTALSDIPTRARQLRGMSHRSGRKLARALQALRRPTSLCRDLSQLLPAHSRSGEVSPSSPGDLRAVPLVRAFHRRQVRVKTAYKDDEKNTPQTTAMLLKIGGHTWQGSVGIHGRHLDEGSRICHIAIDDQRQVISVVITPTTRARLSNTSRATFRLRNSSSMPANIARWIAWIVIIVPRTPSKYRKTR